jgi:hypothetical protein
VVKKVRYGRFLGVTEAGDGRIFWKKRKKINKNKNKIITPTFVGLE